MKGRRSSSHRHVVGGNLELRVLADRRTTGTVHPRNETDSVWCTNNANVVYVPVHPATRVAAYDSLGRAHFMPYTASSRPDVLGQGAPNLDGPRTSAAHSFASLVMVCPIYGSTDDSASFSWHVVSTGAGARGGRHVHCLRATCHPIAAPYAGESGWGAHFALAAARPPQFPPPIIPANVLADPSDNASGREQQPKRWVVVTLR